MIADAPLIFFIGKSIDSSSQQLLSLAQQLGYNILSTLPTQREQACKCIQVFESDPFPILYENYYNNIEVFYL
jgi:hypothetical protein